MYRCVFVRIKPLRIKRAKKVAGFVLILFLLVYFFEFITNTKTLFLLWFYSEDISCHSVKGDVLPSSDDCSPSNRNIFFLETSCRCNLTSRGLCSIESAARAHPDYQINVFFTGPISKDTLEHFNRLIQFENVRFLRIHILEYTRYTPVESVVKILNRSKYGVEHTSDLLRYLILYQCGGIYLDVDMVVAKRFDTLVPNWAARESSIKVANGAISFSKDIVGKSVAADTMSEFQRDFRYDLWSHNGPGVLTRILKTRCNTTDVTRMNIKTCQGFEIYGPELFYPITWERHYEYFEPGILENKDAYVYHVWNHLTRNRRPDKDSPYAQLARKFCPSIYSSYGDKFGL